MNNNNIKLFQMNDYDWVCAESIEQANDWYKKEFDLSEEEQPIEDVVEVPLELEFLWHHTDAEYYLNVSQLEVEYIGKEKEKYYKVPFSMMIDLDDCEMPYVAGSTEW